jgi:hypothetical protein
MILAPILQKIELSFVGSRRERTFNPCFYYLSTEIYLLASFILFSTLRLCFKEFRFYVATYSPFFWSCAMGEIRLVRFNLSVGIFDISTPQRPNCVFGSCLDGMRRGQILGLLAGSGPTSSNR